MIIMKQKYRPFTDQEMKWVRKFQKVMNSAPNTLFLFVGSGMTIYPKDENNHRYMNENGSVDQKPESEGIITNIEYDGGDY